MAKPHQVLLIDNDEQKRQFLEVSLRRAGFEVTTASSHQQALVEVERSKPGLVLSELRAPNVDGVSLCKKLKANQAMASVPVLFLAPDDRESTHAPARAAGADDIVTKPAFVRDIVERAQTLIANLEHHTDAAPAAFPAFRVSLHDVDLVGLLEDVAERVERFVIDLQQSDGGLGSLTVSNGIIVHADFGHSKPREALQNLLRLSAGMVHVRPGKTSHFRTLTIPVKDCRQRFVARDDAQTLSLKELEALHSALRSDRLHLGQTDRTDELRLGVEAGPAFVQADIALQERDDDVWSVDANWDDISQDHLTREFQKSTFEIDEAAAQRPDVPDPTRWIVGLAALTLTVVFALHTAMS